MIAIATDFILIVHRAMNVMTMAIFVALSLQAFMCFLALLGQQVYLSMYWQSFHSIIFAWLLQVSHLSSFREGYTLRCHDSISHTFLPLSLLFMCATHSLTLFSFSFFIPKSLSLSLTSNISVCLSICLPVCISVCLPAFLSVCLYICLPVCHRIFLRPEWVPFMVPRVSERR